MMPEITLDRPNWLDESGRKLFVALRRRWPVVAAVALVLAVGAYAYSKTLPPVYKASGRIFLNTAAGGGAAPDAMRQVNTQAQLAGSTPVLVQISKELHLPPEVIPQRLIVTPDQKGNYFTLDGTGPTPAAAVQLVTAAQQAY